jgi:LDH2 family malate/lactate/ureidoglycolate dehydrogenase
MMDWYTYGQEAARRVAQVAREAERRGHTGYGANQFDRPMKVVDHGRAESSSHVDTTGGAVLAEEEAV